MVFIRPTTRDLAEEAGVSLATVDRVLNDRSSVSAKSRKKVFDAIEKTGFVRNSVAGNLARNKILQFQFVLPTEGDLYLQALLQKIEDARQTQAPEMVNVSTHQTPIKDPHQLANYLTELSPENIDGVAVMAPESPPVRDALTRLQERGIQVVQFLSGQENLDHFDFVGVDNHAAGATAGRLMGRFLVGSVGSIMVVSETMQSLDSIQRRLGFDQVMAKNFPNLTVLPTLETHGNKARAERIIARVTEHNADLVGVYVLSAEARVPIELLGNCRDLSTLTIMTHERTPFTESYLRQNHLDAIIAQNPGHAVRSALKIMRDRIEKRAPTTEQVRMRIEILLPDNL